MKEPSVKDYFLFRHKRKKFLTSTLSFADPILVMRNVALPPSLPEPPRFICLVPTLSSEEFIHSSAGFRVWVSGLRRRPG